MLVNNPIPPNGYRHNYIRLAFIIGALILFIGHVVIDQLSERGQSLYFPNATLYAEELVQNDIIPSNWVYRSLIALNYIWQFSWLFYSITLIYRRSTGGYLYLSPKTLTPTFYITYILAFLIQTIWLVFFHQTYILWTWVIYFVSFVFLLLALFIISNNITVNKKIYLTEGYERDIWYLRFFGQNGIAFFACWTAIRCVLAFNSFLQFKFGVTMLNSGTICLVIIGLIASAFFFGPSLSPSLIERCAYQFSPWIVFVIFFWGTVENNWIKNNRTRNNIIALIELIFCILTALISLVIFTIRYRSLKIDQIA